MKLIVGLGNPGEKYANTRHNCGFIAVEHFFKDCSKPSEDWSNNSKLKSEIAIVNYTPKVGKPEKLILAKPQTFMNDSGQAVRLLMDFYKIEADDLWVVYDELDLPMGHLKIRNGGAAAGHHGVESIMEHVGTDKFWRFRLGIGDSHDREHPLSKQNIRDAKEYVLDVFSHGDQGKAREMVKHASQALETALEKGMETAMNRFNQ